MHVFIFLISRTEQETNKAYFFCWNYMARQEQRKQRELHIVSSYMLNMAHIPLGDFTC